MHSSRESKYRNISRSNCIQPQTDLPVFLCGISNSPHFKHEPFSHVFPCPRELFSLFQLAETYVRDDGSNISVALHCPRRQRSNVETQVKLKKKKRKKKKESLVRFDCAPLVRADPTNESLKALTNRLRVIDRSGGLRCARSPYALLIFFRVKAQMRIRTGNRPSS